MVLAVALIDVGGSAARHQQLGNTASKTLSRWGGVFKVENGLRKPAEIVDGYIVCGCAHGGPQPFPTA